MINLAAFDVTIAEGAGVTLVGNMVVNDGSATFRVRRLTSSTVSISRLETGGVDKRGVSTAWVNFDGTTSPPTIRDSYNVADVVDIGVGQYDIVFETPMDIVGYSVGGSVELSAGTLEVITSTATINRFRVNIRDSVSASQDSYASVNIFGGKSI